MGKTYTLLVRKHKQGEENMTWVLSGTLEDIVGQIVDDTLTEFAARVEDADEDEAEVAGVAAGDAFWAAYDGSLCADRPEVTEAAVLDFASRAYDTTHVEFDRDHVMVAARDLAKGDMVDWSQLRSVARLRLLRVWCEDTHYAGVDEITREGSRIILNCVPEPYSGYVVVVDEDAQVAVYKP